MDASTITQLVSSVTKPWAKQRKAEERSANARARRHEAMTRIQRETIKEVAREIMEAAYLKASSGGTLPAHARQIMYAARGQIQERTGRQLDDQYFCQTLLPDFLNEYPEKADDWDVVFDARGHFREPHTDCVVPLGTLDVRDYLEKVEDQDDDTDKSRLGVKLPTSERFPTCGPRSRFGAILFIEKEGFLPLFDRVKLAERYDLAIMSTKGMSVTASRLLIDELCGNGNSIPLFVLHDFDKAGFSILGTLQRDTRRYEFKNHVHVVDLGLRLEDIERYSLESERVHYGKSDPSWNLRDNGATEKEIAFLCEEDHRWGSSRGRRVELNAFASGDLIEWIEGKLKEHRVKKVLPERECLEAAYRRSLGIEELRREVKRTEKAIARKVKDAKVPRGLERAIKLRLRDEPELSWDAALAEEVRQRLKSNGNGHAGGEG